MDVSDASMTEKICYKSDISGSQFRATLTALVAQGPSSFIVVRRLDAGYKTYFPERSVQEWLSMDNTFSRVQDLKLHGTYLGFDIATFHGVRSGATPQALSCVEFVRGWGNPRGEFNGRAGLLHVLEGSYCQAVSSELSDREIGRVLSTIHVQRE